MPAYSVTGTGVEWSDALVKEAAEACGCSAATQARPNPKRIKFTGLTQIRKLTQQFE